MTFQSIRNVNGRAAGYSSFVSDGIQIFNFSIGFFSNGIKMYSIKQL